MKEVYVTVSGPKVTRKTEVVGSVRTEDGSEEGRDRLCIGMHRVKHELVKDLQGACAAAGNLACRRVLQSWFIMPNRTSADITLHCEHVLSDGETEFPLCALAGDTELDPRNAVRVALSNIDAE